MRGNEAVAFWGGDLYVFNTNEGTPTSSISRVSVDGGPVEVVIPDLGFAVNGASVSTCAPTSAVR
jgi:hypothetical protein